MAESIAVTLRLRPFSQRELQAGHSQITHVTPTAVTLQDPSKKEKDKNFTFDAVFDHTSTQREVYARTAYKLTEAVLGGYNATVFAYGQTGTGKTFSMQGISTPEKDLIGIIPLTFEHIFSHINSQQNTQFLVRASYLEIYNEEIRDLLAPSNKRLELKENAEKTVYVKDLSNYVAKNAAEMQKIMDSGNSNRSVGATLMNAESSRSHSIFSIVVESSVNDPQTGEQHVKVGKLNLVDLAGSERQSKTGATGDRLKEATKINLSLTALGNVIASLVDAKSSHVPYRDSKLTRLLQDSLGGNAKTLMLATMSPASYNYEETLSTLRYANRTKNIKNKPKINEDPKDAMLREYQEEINRLRKELETGGGDGEFSEEDEDLPSTDPGIPALHRQNSKLARNEANQAAQEQLQKEKEAILASTTIVEAEKQQILANIAQRAADLDQEKRAKQELAEKLQQMESKLLVGGENLLDKQEKLMQQLQEREKELEAEHQAAMEKEVQLQKAQAWALETEGSYATLQEAANAKRKKTERLISMIELQEAELADKKDELGRERDDLLDTFHELSRDLRLKEILIDHFLPEDSYQMIRDFSQWDDATEEWRIMHVNLSGNALKKEQTSAGVSRRPGTRWEDKEPKEVKELRRLLDNLPEYSTYESLGVQSSAQKLKSGRSTPTGKVRGLNKRYSPVKSSRDLKTRLGSPNFQSLAEDQPSPVDAPAPTLVRTVRKFV